MIKGIVVKKGAVEAVVTGLLVVVLMFLTLTRLRSKGREAKPKTPTAATPTPELLARIEQLKKQARDSDPETNEKRMDRASLPWGRDPFFVSGTESVEQNAARPALVCRGISCTEGEPAAFALINYAVLTEGESINGYLVTHIAQDRVILEKGGRTYVLSVGAQ